MCGGHGVFGNFRTKIVLQTDFENNNLNIFTNVFLIINKTLKKSIYVIPSHFAISSNKINLFSM